MQIAGSVSGLAISNMYVHVFIIIQDKIWFDHIFLDISVFFLFFLNLKPIADLGIQRSQYF